MSLPYIRRYYRVPAKRGRHVSVDGRHGVIVGARGPHLRVRFTGDKRTTPCHPIWRVVYLADRIVATPNLDLPGAT